MKVQKRFSHALSLTCEFQIFEFRIFKSSNFQIFEFRILELKLALEILEHFPNKIFF
jgi:hypothetical protein